MVKISKNLLDKHIRTHSERSEEDRAAVALLKSFLRADGKIAENINCNDTWPNIDGAIEYVSDPNYSRRPEQKFVVQVKGTKNYSEKNGVIKYSLKSLAFPAYIFQEVTLDPGILFVVLNPVERGKERIFWKYMSVEFLNSIDYVQDSYTISFTEKEELRNTNESLELFCNELGKISRHHSFVKKLENIEYSLEDIKKIITRCDNDITESLDRFEIYNETRDNVSKRILSRLEDLCQAALLMSALKIRGISVNLQLAWEQALFNRRTRYLSNFLRMLKYIGHRVPDEGQSERLMLNYYDFMWQIRDDLKKDGIFIIKNLEKFPLKENITDKSYYENVSKAIESQSFKGASLKRSRYYIEKQTPFYVDGNRYYELTLQLAGIYATKFNRITAYTKEYIPANYSIQIGYEELDIVIWDVETKIKFINNWKVSIEPACLNKMAKILKLPSKLTTKYGEYDALMEYLTKTGINLLDLIDCKELDFRREIEKIYNKTNTAQYKRVLLHLQCDFNSRSQILGKNTIRYLLIRMREEAIEAALPGVYDKLLQNDSLYLSAKCFPFENNPLISNFAKSKTSKYTIAKDVVRAVGYEQIDKMRPYLTVKKLIGETGEIYFDEQLIEGDNTARCVQEFNKQLDEWERKNGFSLEYESGEVYIESFEQDTIYILKRLFEFSRSGNKGQESINKSYIKTHETLLEDDLKKQALAKLFVSSKVMLIYGAAGTGKTTLINYISNLMGGRRKLFLTKTHTALQHLQRAIENPGTNVSFVSMDSFTKKVKLQEYDVIFVDECSTIDNRTMARFFDRVTTDTMIVLAGDIYQLDAIDFGNWFLYAKELVSNDAKIELLNTWRTEQTSLIELWNEVREKGLFVKEKLAMDGPFSAEIGKCILQKLSDYDDDEVILCLNYDGKFGLNNINALFQANNNQSMAYSWQEWTYKEGDPILFTESKRFPTVFYNNLKGRIVQIDKKDSCITFTVDIDRLLTENDCVNEVEYIATFDNSTRVKFTIYEDDGGGTDEERAESRMKSIVPFHLAYAVSIHKAQGLEYDSVKIIIPDSNAERITHDIFYTAITRAKKRLKIYWSPETMKEILASFVEKKENRSLAIIQKKLFG